MTTKKLISICTIYIFAVVAWMILGVSNMSRTDDSFRTLKALVVNLFGDELIIKSPVCFSNIKGYSIEIIDGKKIKKEMINRSSVELIHSKVDIKVNLDQRKKGNLWFPTFNAKFTGRYAFKIDNKYPDAKYTLLSTLESINSIYNDIKLEINGEVQKDVLPLIKKEEINVTPTDDGLIYLKVEYISTGMDNIKYLISPDVKDIMQINDFSLDIETDFKDFDFPNNMISPTGKTELPEGYILSWRYKNSVTGKDIGLAIPNKLNPGEIVSRVTFFAPISLLFFFVVIFVISIMLKTDLHPMNYFFLAATFFSFHLMYSYFSDHLNIYLTFGIASIASLFLTVTYLRLFTPTRLAYIFAPIIQLIYLIVFSFSFFYKGMTGVIVTICSVITLFILMQITGRTNWDTVFSKNGSGNAS